MFRTGYIACCTWNVILGHLQAELLFQILIWRNVLVSTRCFEIRLTRSWTMSLTLIMLALSFFTTLLKGKFTSIRSSDERIFQRIVVCKRRANKKVQDKCEKLYNVTIYLTSNRHMSRWTSTQKRWRLIKPPKFVEFIPLSCFGVWKIKTKFENNVIL